MHKLGLSAPQDFVIAGYNDTEISLLCDPALTTVRQDFEYIGRWLLKSAMAMGRAASSNRRSQPACKPSFADPAVVPARLPQICASIAELELVEQSEIGLPRHSGMTARAGRCHKIL